MRMNKVIMKICVDIELSLLEYQEMPPKQTYELAKFAI